MAVGDELLDVPFAEMVRSLATAIAEGQLALDRSSIETLRVLVRETVDIIPEVTEVIEASQHTVVVDGKPVPVSGVNIRASGAEPVAVSLFQAGLQPTFYQFTEANLEVKLSISVRRTAEQSGQPAEGQPRLPVRAFASSVNYRTANTYSYTAEGSSVLRATLRPVPPPPRVMPQTVVVNTLTQPPTVTTTG